ncbi:MAG TPA: VOC family protein [Dehalococcoidia bacterium]|jgi:hypothetical protein
MSGNLSYFTIPTPDLQRGRAFYGGLFGWQFDAENSHDAYAHIGNTEPGGGLHAHEGTSVSVWFRVDEIQAAVARVRELGGHADEPALSDSGWRARCRDDQGAGFNLWQPAQGFA